MATCRLCGEDELAERTNGPLIHYGVRHYAHAKCALERWGAAFFQRLALWPLKRFPALFAHRAGLLEALAREIAAREGESTTKEAVHVE
jgi:hypothetical protein